MSASLERLIEELQERFPSRGLVMVNGDVAHLRFPAIHAAVGDIEIYDDGDEYTVVYGNFTHCHYENDAIESLVEDLDALFSNRLRMWGSHDASGGIVREGYDDDSLRPLGEPLSVWTGPLTNAA